MQNHVVGFGLSLVTAVLWGVLPIFLTICLSAMDSPTITFYRFVFAAVFVFVLLYSRKALPDVRRIPKGPQLLLLFVAFALVVNYVGNVESLKFVAPETVQVLMQLAPLLLMLGGIVFFKERFSRLEAFGALTLIVGLGLFFNERLAPLFADLDDFSWGVLLVIGAAIAWAVYALLQKRLFRFYTAKQLTVMIYSLGGLMLLPFTQLEAILNMNGLEYAALAFCCLNTVIAYGAFTEAMNIWHASKVSAVISLAPVFTFLSMYVAVDVFPEYIKHSELNSLAYIGALVVVCGSMLAALGRGQVPKTDKPSH